MPKPFFRDKSKSQLWNEKCFIHCLRMIGIGIDGEFQKAVAKMVEEVGGQFKSACVKGYTRMVNKCRSKDDHFEEKYPRYAFFVHECLCTPSSTVAVFCVKDQLQT